ncbi:hypothetical protein R1flu_010118 [Riccia fluitans]|uniref:Secreted protein n=1 Tax=Riccia fluitans TaxID=41844 RepID=A0ABD1Z428_9MARC
MVLLVTFGGLETSDPCDLLCGLAAVVMNVSQCQVVVLLLHVHSLLFPLQDAELEIGSLFLAAAPYFELHDETCIVTGWDPSGFFTLIPCAGACIMTGCC